MLYINLISI